MAFLNSIVNLLGADLVTPAAPGKMWHWFILTVFDFVADYGWRIVVFTLLLKLVLSPLDFYQRYKMHKNQKITERLRPTMEKIQKQFGDNKQAFQQKQMELNRKEGYSYFSSCLPMILTMVIFITLWLSMNTVAQYKMLNEYTTLYNEYAIVQEQVETEKGKENTALIEEIGEDVVYTLYYDGIDQIYVQSLRDKYGLSSEFKLEDKKPLQAKFLWIENIWAPDVPWGGQAIMDYETFTSAIGDYATFDKNGIPDKQREDSLNPTAYERVMRKLLNDTTHSHTNGYLILPILVVLMSVLSQLITSLQQKRAGQINAKGGMAMGMKVMMFVMPLMMGFFAIRYAAIFTLYMVTNTTVSLALNFGFTALIKAVDKYRQNKHYGISTGSVRADTSDRSPIIHYVKGANPNAGARETAVAADTGAAGGEKTKKSKKDKNAAPAVMRSGRPDPNELMNYSMNKGQNNKKKK